MGHGVLYNTLMHNTVTYTE